MPASHAACRVAAAVDSSTLTNNSPRGAVPKPSRVSSTPVFPSFRVSVGFIYVPQHCDFWPFSPPARNAALQRFEEDSAENDRASGEALPEDLDAGEIEEVARERDDDDTDDGAQDLALTAKEAGAADDDGRDHLEFQAFTRIGRHCAEAREANDSRERGGEAHDHQALDLDPVGADAGQHRDHLVGADRIDALAEGCPFEDEPADRVNQHRDPGYVLDRKPGDQRLARFQPASEIDRQWDLNPAALAEPGYPLRHVGNGLAAHDDERQAARHHQRAQGDDEGRDLRLGDDDSDDQPEQRP